MDNNNNNNTSIMLEHIRSLNQAIDNIQTKIDMNKEEVHSNNLLIQDLKNSLIRLEETSKATKDELEKHLVDEMDSWKSLVKYFKIGIVIIGFIGLVVVDESYPNLELFEKFKSTLEIFSF
jgi:chromosome segregation ATPase